MYQQVEAAARKLAGRKPNRVEARARSTNDPALPDSPDRSDLAGGPLGWGASNFQSGVCHLDKDQSLTVDC